MSETCQKLEPELHSSVTKLLQTNKLDHLIDSDMGSKITCFQVAIFSINVDAIREQKCCISHSPTELMFIKFPCNDSAWKISANMHRHMERVMYWKQF